MFTRKITELRLQISKEKNGFLHIKAGPAGLRHQTWQIGLHGIVLSLATGRLRLYKKSLKRGHVTCGLRMHVQVISLFKADSLMFPFSLLGCWSWNTWFTFKPLWFGPKRHPGFTAHYVHLGIWTHWPLLCCSTSWISSTWIAFASPSPPVEILLIHHRLPNMRRSPRKLLWFFKSE